MMFNRVEPPQSISTAGLVTCVVLWFEQVRPNGRVCESSATVHFRKMAESGETRRLDLSLSLAEL